MNNVTEVSLDDLDSSVPSVSIDKIDDATTDMSQQNIDAIEDLDLLVDPNKSKSPVPTNPSLEEEANKIEQVPISSPPPIIDNKLDDDLDFKIRVERPPEKPTNSFMSSPTFNPVPMRSVINDGAERQELLFKLKRLESRGIPLSKHYNTSSSLGEMKEEYTRLKNQRDLENSIKFQRKSMMAFASGVEFLNSKFDPFDIKLDGWSESLHENLSDYDDVFEELHEKYKSKTNIAPELKLLMMLGGSAVMFHMTNSLFKNSMPQMDDILKNNPDLARQFASAAVSSTTEKNPGLGHILGDMLETNAPPTFVPPQPSFVPDAPPPPSSTQMNGPNDQDVERILNQIKDFREEPNPITTAVKPEPMNPEPPATREVNISNNIPTKKKRGRPPKNRVERPDTSSFALNI